MLRICAKNFSAWLRHVMRHAPFCGPARRMVFNRELRSNLPRASFCFLFLFSLLACQLPEEKVVTRGKLLVLVPESHHRLLEREALEFNRLYPDAQVTVAATTTREAIVHMLNDSARVICTDRLLNEEEMRVAKAAELEIVETKIAEDALAVVVHRHNPMENLTLASLRDIVSGAKKQWREVPEAQWSGQIELALPGRNSGTYEILTRHFLKLETDAAPAFVGETSAAVLQYVDSHPYALGVVSVAAMQDSLPNLRELKLEAADSAAALPFVSLHQANVYRGWYPLHYALYLYRPAQHAGIALGFISFVASPPGQKIILNAKLVPATMPIRIVQLNEN